MSTDRRNAIGFLKSIVDSSNIGIRAKQVAPDRVAAMKEHLRRFVDQEALYVMRTEDQVVMIEYLIKCLEMQIAADEEITEPDLTSSHFRGRRH